MVRAEHDEPGGAAVGTHDAPASWLERWRAQEPLRLWLWTIASAVIALASVAGWLTAELAVPITGIAAAVLMLGGTAAARRQVYAPATVDRLLDSQHATSYQQGVEDGLRVSQERTPEQVADELATVQMRAQPGPGARGRLGRCRYVESGRRCTLPAHPEKVRHQLEAPRVQE